MVFSTDHRYTAQHKEKYMKTVKKLDVYDLSNQSLQLNEKHTTEQTEPAAK